MSFYKIIKHIILFIVYTKTERWLKLMKKFIAIFSIFLFLSLNMNTMTAVASHKVFKKGFYTLEDLHLSENIVYSIENTSQNNYAFVLIFDSQQIIQQAIRLKPQSQKYTLIPLQYDYTIVLLGDAELSIS